MSQTSLALKIIQVISAFFELSSWDGSVFAAHASVERVKESRLAMCQANSLEGPGWGEGGKASLEE